MKLERMALKDVDEVMEIENNSFIDPWPYHFFVDDISKNEFSRYFVLKDNDEIIGYSGYWLSFENCDLVNIAIKEKWRGQKYGQKLLNLTILEAIKEGCEFMHLEVRPSNIKAINLYEKSGFIKTRVRKGYYEDGEDCIDMVKGIVGLSEKDFSD